MLSVNRWWSSEAALLLPPPKGPSGPDDHVVLIRVSAGARGRAAIEAIFA